MDTLRHRVVDHPAPDRPEVRRFLRGLRQVIGAVYDPHVLMREHLPDPAIPQMSGDRLARKRADQHRQVLDVLAGELDQELVPAVRGEELAEDEAAAPSKPFADAIR